MCYSVGKYQLFTCLDTNCIYSVKIDGELVDKYVPAVSRFRSYRAHQMVMLGKCISENNICDLDL